MRQKGYYGSYGGQYVPELLMPALSELEQGYHEIAGSDEFHFELFDL